MLMSLSYSPQDRHKALGDSSLDTAKLRAAFLPLVSQWPPASWARAWQEEEAHQVRAACSDLCSFSALFWPQSYGEVTLTSSAKRLADKCVRRASGARGMEPGGEVCASWLKFKPGNVNGKLSEEANGG